MKTTITKTMTITIPQPAHMQIDEVVNDADDFPDANAVMAAICCASAQFSTRPSLDLALLIEDLAYTLSSHRYAKTPLMKCVAERLVHQWGEIADNQESRLLQDLNPLQPHH